MNNPNVRYIPPVPPKREQKVAIVVSVQILKSLAAQVSALTRFLAAVPQWLLVDVYMDIASGGALKNVLQMRSRSYIEEGVMGIPKIKKEN